MTLVKHLLCVHGIIEGGTNGADGTAAEKWAHAAWCTRSTPLCLADERPSEDG